MGLGNSGKGAIISGEQRPTIEGNMGKRTILGNREHKETNFRLLGEQGNKPNH